MFEGLVLYEAGGRGEGVVLPQVGGQTDELHGLLERVTQKSRASSGSTCHRPVPADALLVSGQFLYIGVDACAGEADQRFHFVSGHGPDEVE